jgi:hypothetical protein
MNESNQYSHRDSDMSINSQQQQQQQQHLSHRHSSFETTSMASGTSIQQSANGATGQSATTNIQNKKQQHDMSSASFHANNSYNEFNSYNEETIHKVIFIIAVFSLIVN